MEEFKCKRCGHEASSLWNLKSHLSRATPCLDINLCGKSQDELLKDITVDKTDWEFECNTCGAKYRSRQGLHFHIKNKKCKLINYEEDVSHLVGSSTDLHNDSHNTPIKTNPVVMVDKAVQTSKDDKDLIIQELKMKLELVKLDYKRTKEEYYQFHLEFHFGASHLVCDTGITDITTNDMHIEIKNWKSWKEVTVELIIISSTIC